MRNIGKDIKIAEELYAILCSHGGNDKEAEKLCHNLAAIVREFQGRNWELLKKRKTLQKELNAFFMAHKEKKPTVSEVVAALRDIGYIKEDTISGRVPSGNLAPEIYPMAGPQLVVPADKANMVLNALNARWGNLDQALYASNIIVGEDEKQRKKEVIAYRNGFLNSLIQFCGEVRFSDIVSFSFDEALREVTGKTADGETVGFKKGFKEKVTGINYKNGKLGEFVIGHHGLGVEFILDAAGAIKDIQLESVLTFIMDLEDASHSAPENKFASYRHIKGIVDENLTCNVRGGTRYKHEDTTYIDPATGNTFLLKRTALPLVREAGGHLFADTRIIMIDGEPVSEKILDCFITSLLGIRYHVVPKLHGEEEVAFTVGLWERISETQGLEKHANKLGVMNEEVRLNGQLASALWKAKDVIFFVNSGFMDYTGSFIDAMMYQGPIAPYRALPGKQYKISYEKHNVEVGLKLGIAQTGAGMWPKIRDMKGLLNSKIEQVKQLNDTGWSPSPMAGTIHTMAFHIAGDVREQQRVFLSNPTGTSLESMFTFPGLEPGTLIKQEIKDNLNFAIHGLLAYAEPWVRRGIGCSGIKELAGEPLMEDRATARIKTAFVRNWLLHGVISREDILASITEMAVLVDGQNEGDEAYIPLSREGDNVIEAVKELVFNDRNYLDSYVEPVLYAAYKREQQGQG